MNPPPDRERLLDEVLSEAAPADFRAALLGETLRLARGRRRFRQARRTGAALAVVCLLGIVVWRNLPSRGAAPNPPPPSVTACEIIHTQPLPAAAIIRTRSFGADRLVASFASVGEIRTASAEEVLRFVSDDELLALAAPQPVALVRIGPNTQELIFVKPPEETDSR